MSKKMVLMVLILIFLSFSSSSFALPPEAELPALIGPYLQNPGLTSMTVCLVTKDVSGIRVELKETGTINAREIIAKSVRIPDTEWTIFKACLKDLKKGSEYEYSVQYDQLDIKHSTQNYRFRTLANDKRTINVAIFNDLHDRVSTLNALMEHCSPDEYDFSILLGDCWNDPKTADRALYLLDNYIKLLNAGEKPMLFVRGNHEYRGAFAHDLAYLFDLPNLDASQPTGKQHFNFALSAGPAWFLVMDCGEDFEKMNDIMMPYREYQAQWIKSLLERKEGADADWRIFVSHIPLYNKNIWNSEPSRQTWESVLTNADIDFALAAHDHNFKTLEAGETFKVTHDPEYTENRGEWEMTPPYPVIIGGGPELDRATVRLLNADETTIRVRTIMAKDGTVCEEFVLKKNKN